MVAEVTQQPLDDVSDFDCIRWASHWKSTPPLAQQNRDLLLQLCLMLSSALGMKNVNQSTFLPHLEEEKAEEVEQQAAIDYWTAHFIKLGAKHGK